MRSAGRPERLLQPPRPRLQGRRRSSELRFDAALQAIWEVVGMIPRGLVRSYGEVARSAGLPGRARQVGYALRVMPPGLHLPWHRVLGAGGRIVFPKGSPQYREQCRRLRSEGVAVSEGRVARAALMDQ